MVLPTDTPGTGDTSLAWRAYPSGYVAYRSSGNVGSNSYGHTIADYGDGAWIVRPGGNLGFDNVSVVIYSYGYYDRLLDRDYHVHPKNIGG